MMNGATPDLSHEMSFHKTRQEDILEMLKFISNKIMRAEEVAETYEEHFDLLNRDV